MPASGKGNVTVDGVSYPFWAQDDDTLAGARYDAAIDAQTRKKINLAAHPALSANDPDTVGDETRTHIILTGSAASGEGMFSFGDLLGGGTATNEGARFVSDAVESISKVRSDVSALLSLETPPSGLPGILDNQWTKLEDALATVFTSAAVRTSAPREEDILAEIDDVLDALSSEDAFVATAEEDGDGVFESQELDASDAMDTFNRVKWSATATMGSTGATRYGTAIRESTTNAGTELSSEEYGAFSYSTMSETVRTSQAAALSLTGIASYTGGTEAIAGDGSTYSGMMDLQVRFSANTVSGVVKDLIDADGLPWQHNFADVERIVLDDAKLLRSATWNNGTGTKATVFYTADSGLLRPITGLTNTFRGILLGSVADAGSQANGLWSLNASGSTNYLTGGFGVMHVGDASNATLITTRDRTGYNPTIVTPTRCRSRMASSR